MDEISTKDAAAILGVLPRQVRWYWEKGLLPGQLFIDRLMFKRADVESFVKPSHPKNRWIKKPKATPAAKKPAKAKAAPKPKSAPKPKGKKGASNAP